MNRPITLYAVVLPFSTTTPPNLNQVKLGVDSAGSSAIATSTLSITAANTNFNLELTSSSLVHRTIYKVYLFAEDPSQPEIIRFSAPL